MSPDGCSSCAPVLTIGFSVGRNVHWSQCLQDWAYIPREKCGWMVCIIAVSLSIEEQCALHVHNAFDCPESVRARNIYGSVSARLLEEVPRIQATSQVVRATGS